MRRPLAVATFGILATLIGVQPSPAGVPNAANSFVTPCFVSCPFGDFNFIVTVRDAANNPVANSTVELDFSTCSGVTFCAAQEPGTTLNPTLKSVARITDSNGLTVFRLHMGGLCPGAQMKVTADGVPLAFRNVSSLDQDGDLTVVAADQAILAGKAGSSDPSGDFDCSGLVDEVDASMLFGHLGHMCDLATPALPRSWGRIKVIYR